MIAGIGGVVREEEWGKEGTLLERRNIRVTVETISDDLLQYASWILTGQQ